MVKRGEEQSINVPRAPAPRAAAPRAAALPRSFAGVVSQGARAIAVAGEAIVDFVLEPGGSTTLADGNAMAGLRREP